MQEQYLMTFLTVAEHQSFSKAAKLLNLSQPTVSHQIQYIEAYYNTQLFLRQSRKITLTKDGEILREHASQIIKMYHAAKESLQRKDIFLQISCSNTICDYLLPQIMASFLQKYPEFPAHHLQIIPGTTDQALDELKYDRTQLALVEGKQNKYPFIHEAFYQDELLLAFPPQQIPHPSLPCQAENLQKENWLIREPGCQIRQATEELWQKLGLDSATLNKFEFRNNHMIKEGVKSGLGVALLSSLLVQSELINKQLSFVECMGDKKMKRTFSIIRKQKSFPSIAHQRFWKHILNWQ